MDRYLRQGPDLERLREIVRCEILGPFGMDSFEVIQNIHTPMGFQKMMSTPLWKGGKCLCEWKDDALPEFCPFEKRPAKGRLGLLGFALDKLLP